MYSKNIHVRFVYIYILVLIVNLHNNAIISNSYSEFDIIINSFKIYLLIFMYFISYYSAVMYNKLTLKGTLNKIT
jgi:hypothetical protein